MSEQFYLVIVLMLTLVVSLASAVRERSYQRSHQRLSDLFKKTYGEDSARLTYASSLIVGLASTLRDLHQWAKENDVVFPESFLRAGQEHLKLAERVFGPLSEDTPSPTQQAAEAAALPPQEGKDAYSSSGEL